MLSLTQKQNPTCSAGSADIGPIVLAGASPLQLRLLSCFTEPPPRSHFGHFRGETAPRALATLRRRAPARAVLRLFLRRGSSGGLETLRRRTDAETASGCFEGDGAVPEIPETLRRRAAVGGVLLLFLRRGYVGGCSPAAFTTKRPRRRCRKPCGAEPPPRNLCHHDSCVPSPTLIFVFHAR